MLSQYISDFADAVKWRSKLMKQSTSTCSTQSLNQLINLYFFQLKEGGN